jgi:DNA-binding transcriptional ArsR family regulator
MIFPELSADESTIESFAKSLEKNIHYCVRKFGKTPVVFLDTMADALDIEELNNHSETVNKLGQLRSVIRKTGCTVVMTHHYNKNTNANVRNRVTGAKGIRSKCDIIFDLLFSDTDDSQSLRSIGTSKVRITPHLKQTVLDYDPETAMVFVSVSQLTVEERKTAESDSVIIKAIVEKPDGLCKKEIAALTEMSEATVSRALSRLQRSGAIVQGKPRKSGKFGPACTPFQVQTMHNSTEVTA